MMFCCGCGCGCCDGCVSVVDVVMYRGGVDEREKEKEIEAEGQVRVAESAGKMFVRGPDVCDVCRPRCC